VRAFAAWQQLHRLGDPATVPAFDERLAAYVTVLCAHRGGRGRQQAVAAMYGCIMLQPSLRDHLPSASAALNGWRRLRPSRQHPPMTWELTCAVSDWLAAAGEPGAAVATLLAFDCLLRVGELCALTARDVIDTGADIDMRLGPGVLLWIKHAKTEDDQSALVMSVPVRAMLVKRASAARSRGEPLFGLSAPQFRVAFKRACAGLGLSDRFVPHSLRHGGATWLYVSGTPVETIKVRGRWGRLSTAQHYCQSGQAVAGAHGAPAATRERGRLVAAAFAAYVPGGAAVPARQQ
jgi:hypothetical protein